MIFFRLIVPLSIFHYPLFGGLASTILDGFDWSVNLFNLPGLHTNYVLLDKVLDIYYLSIEAWVLLKWKSFLAKKIGITLYMWRMVGVILFAFLGKEYLFFWFPNIFESFFMFYVAVNFFLKREVKMVPLTLWVSLGVLAIPKLFQEYIMHIQLVSNWRFITIRGLPFKYDNVVHQLLIIVVLIVVIILMQMNKSKNPQYRKA